MFKSITAQFKAVFTNKKIAIPVLAVLFIPIMYSGTYLWAFWNPYGKMEELPVAVVNQDEGYKHDGENLHAGDDFVEKLKENPSFKWKFVSEEKAQQGLKNNDYYMMIEIPKDFSKNASEVSDDKVKKPELIFTQNQGFNFLASQIGGSAVNKMKESLSHELTKTYAKVMFEQVEELGGGLKQAADGSQKITDGLEKTASGSGELAKGMADKSPQIQQLNSGAIQLNEKMGQLNNGLNQLAAGHKQLLAGQQQLSDGATSLEQGLGEAAVGSGKVKNGSLALQSAAEKLSKGANTLSSSASQWNAGAQKTSAGSKQVEQQLNALIQNQKNMSDEEIAASLKQIAAVSGQVNAGMDGLTAASGKIAEGADQLSSGSKKLSDSQAAVANGAQQVHDGQLKLVNGADQLSKGQAELNGGTQTFQTKLNEAAAGAGKLQSGTKQLADGTAAAANGWNEVSGHVQEIHNGEEQILAGSSELTAKLSDAAIKTDKLDPDDKTFERISNPVNLKTKSYTEVPNYGTGIAPYFLSLGLFVGALFTTIVFPLRDLAGRPRSGFSWFASKFSFLAAVGILQAIIADSILLYGLDIQVSSTPAFFGFTILTSLTFMALVQLLVTILGDPGRFIAIIILVLQLTTSAGTFPLEMIPHKLQVFNSWLPMSYSVSGFRSVISSGNIDTFTSSVWALFGFMTIFMIGTLIFFISQFSKVNKTAE
ncbi:YhgE/Pip domain-containing protein [Bacillus sp. NEB1478]|uniref:YhgE/Pip domain-containing protein n=1 Tax=Bacillus sp. NEB1478 TaxID=3073816 RepID=UPI002872E11E|nr:YhgE/Pip domain-containing protein [Bacillus sp. NEB1478]WNB91426.1 YhgE/Pip domain-containing protein [Bacillus sp. NEB1478]